MYFGVRYRPDQDILEQPKEGVEVLLEPLEMF